MYAKFKTFEVSKEMSEQITRRFLYALKCRDYTWERFVDKKELPPYLVKRLVSGEKLYEEKDLEMLTGALELGKEYFLIEIEGDEEVKLSLYQRFFQLTKENQSQMDGLLTDILSMF